MLVYCICCSRNLCEGLGISSVGTDEGIRKRKSNSFITSLGECYQCFDGESMYYSFHVDVNKVAVVFLILYFQLHAFR